MLEGVRRDVCLQGSLCSPEELRNSLVKKSGLATSVSQKL